MANARFEVYTGGNDEFYFRLVAANGEKILASEGYTSKAGCMNGIESVKKNAPLDERYRKETASDGRSYFKLVAGNNETVGTSQMYKSEDSRDHGIEAVKKAAPDAPVEEVSAD